MRKRTWILIVKALISIILIVYVLSKINKNNEVVDAFELIDIKWVSFAILLMIPNILIQSFRWLVVLRTISKNITFWQAAGSTLGGISLGLLTPGKIGELGKSLFLKNLNKLEITGLALLERIYNMVVILVLGIIGFITYSFITNETYSIMFWSFIAVLVLLLFVIWFLIYYPDFIASFINSRFKNNRYKDKIYIFFNAYKDIQKKDILSIIGLTFIFQLLNSVQFVLAIWAFDIGLNFFEGLTASFTTSFTKAVLPISIADVGIRENAALYYFNFFLNNDAAIFNGSIMIFFINVIFPSLCGLFMLPKMNFQKDLPHD